MKKIINVSILFGIVALFMLMMAGSAGAGGPDMPPPRPTPVGLDLRGSGATLREGAPRSPSGTSVRINFEVGGEKACKGLYTILDQKGSTVASWWAYPGQTDSGWFQNLTIANDTTAVRVLYYPGPNTSPTVMKILNPLPSSSWGWVSRGIAHAIEVAWPGNPPCFEMPDMSHMPPGPMMRMN